MTTIFKKDLNAVSITYLKGYTLYYGRNFMLAETHTDI